MPSSPKRPPSKKPASDSPVTSPRNSSGTPPQSLPAAQPRAFPFLKPVYVWLLLVALVLAALLPFSSRAFHIDDTLFVFAGKNIVQKPFDPYGFPVNWDDYELPMSQITKNPPMACYYVAVAGAVAGWSERPLHLAFLLPALAVILLTYYLARRFTNSPFLAALLTFASPAYLVSAASVMCDVMLLAVWLLALVLWLDGLDARKPLLLASSAALMGVAALTKYFGVALIPLLFAYSLYRQRRLGHWAFYFLIPIAVLVAYQLWTASLYEEGLLLDAAGFASSQKDKATFAGETLEGLSFLGGCMLPALLFVPWLWSRRQMLIGLLASALATILVVTGHVSTAWGVNGKTVAVEAFQAHHLLFSLEFTLFVAGGISALALAVSDFRKHKDSNSLLLLLWVFGTFFFTSYLNWTVNARSILPLLPAVAILIARRLALPAAAGYYRPAFKVAVPLLISAAIAVWVLIGDSQLANASRTASLRAQQLTRGSQGTVWFIGHWGLQYYMEEIGARPVDRYHLKMGRGDYFLMSENNTSSHASVSSAFPRQQFEFPGPSGAITINRAVGAGFYSSNWGPLPFFLGPTPAERYTLVHLVEETAQP